MPADLQTRSHDTFATHRLNPNSMHSRMLESSKTPYRQPATGPRSTDRAPLTASRRCLLAVST